jgi:hypothetical protein
MPSYSTKALLACGFGVLAIFCVLTIDSDSTFYARETSDVQKGKKEGAKPPPPPSKTPVKGEHELRSRIQKAIKVASKSLRTAKGKKQKKLAQLAVKKALAAAGVADADNAGTIAWANRNINVAQKWAQKALKRDAAALGTVAAWHKGDRKLGVKMQKKCENAIQAMVAVASATKNKAQMAKEDKLRNQKKLKSFDGPIKAARKAAMYAGKSVEEARAALAATLGTKARIAAKHALVRAQSAVHDANVILRTEIGKKNVVTANRLQKDGLRLVGESELHYQCRMTYHKANRVLKLVNAALATARKNHFAHKEAVMKQTQKITMEKAAKLQAQERRGKKKKHDAAKALAAREAYAATLAREALKYGEQARDDAKKAAAAGKIAAEKALKSAKLKAKLSKKKKPRSTKMVALALKRETYAAKLADKAAQMESAIVTGSKMPKEVAELVEGAKRHSAVVAAHAAATEADVQSPEEDHQEDFHKFVKSDKFRESEKSHEDDDDEEDED